MNTELLDLAISYLTGEKSVKGFSEWLSGINWTNSDLDDESLRFAELADLLTTEVLEGLRFESDLWEAASKFVESRTTNLDEILSTSNSLEIISANVSDSIVLQLA